jgi:hypothetical protein
MDFFLFLRPQALQVPVRCVTICEMPDRWGIGYGGYGTDMGRPGFYREMGYTMDIPGWLVVSNMVWFFPFHIWNVILPAH